MGIKLSGMISGMDTDSIVKQLVDAQKLKNKRTTDKQTVLTWKQDKWKELNTKLYKLYTEDISKMRLQGSYQTKQVTSSNDSLVSVTAGTSTPSGAHTLSDIKLASAQYVTGSKITETATTSTKITDLYASADGKTITFGKAEAFTIDANTTITTIVDKAKEAGLNASFDATQGRFFISSKESGVSNAFDITSTDATLLNNIGLGAGATKIVAEDSSVTYNGAVLTGSTNVITANGLTITLKGATSTETVSLNVTNNTKATYDMVKNFIKNYNAILKEMNTLYSAESTRSYAPLSDDEKESMTDDQVEKWETRIKDSVLRRDDTVGSLRDAMRSSLMGTVNVGTAPNQKAYSLASFGIQTSSDYKENGVLHLAGDKDDSIYATMEDKLTKALEEDPDAVMKVLSGVTTALYETMTKKMSTIPNFRSALTFYNDKEMDKTQTQYKKQMAILEKKLTAMENKYYKQFSAMETAMAKMQEQSNALSGMVGTNS